MTPPHPQETPEQHWCRAHDWDCPCHATGWGDGIPPARSPAWTRPALRCPSCEHPDLTQGDMDGWWAQWQVHHPAPG